MVEAYLHPEYRPYHEAVHATWIDGKTREFTIGGGVVIVMPWLGEGRRVGVTTAFRPGVLPAAPAPARLQSDRLELREQVRG